MGSYARVHTRQTFGVRLMIDEFKISVSFTGDELYETIKLYDILRDMDFELSETQVQVFEKLQDAEVNGGFF